MKQDLTEIVFILDRSGSMSGLENDTIGGMNSLIEKQQKEPGTALVTTVLFDGQVELLHDRIDIRAISPLTNRDYYVRGTTALLDAIGFAIQKISDAHAHTAEDFRPGHVLFVITTDGYENSSRRYNLPRIRSLISEKQEQGWEFLFLGANIDAVSTAASFGIQETHAANYHADSVGVRTNFEALSEATSCLRAAPEMASMSSSWKSKIDSDLKTRKKKE